MESIIHVIILGIFFLFIIKKDIDVISKRFAVFYVIIWSFGILLSTNEALYEVSDYVYLLVYLHLLCYFIGFYSIKYSPKMPEKNLISIVSKRIDRFVNSSYFNIFFALCLTYVIYLFVKFYSLIILYQSLADLREDFFDAETNIYGSSFGLINTFLLVPLFYSLIPIFSYKCIFKRDFKTIFYGVYLIIYASLGGGRFDYIRIALGFVFVVFCIYNSIINTRIKITLVVTGSAVLMALLVFITMGRSGVFSTQREDLDEGLEMTSKQIAAYSGGPIVALDLSIKNNYTQRIHGPRYGRLTLGALVMPFCVLLRKVGIPINDAIGDLTLIKQDEIIQIGPETRHNALYTSLLFYYNDFGFLGCLLFPLLFGFLSRKTIIIFYKTQSLSSFVLNAVLFLCLFYSIYDFALVNLALFLFCFCLLILKNKV